MSYTLKLIALECFQAQEIDGDELYLTLNDQRVWSAAPDRMKHLPDADGLVSQYDFVGGRKRTQEGWIPLMPYTPDEYTFPRQNCAATLKLWDHDMLTSDDLLGQTPVDAMMAGSGSISVVFQRGGGHYRLTYKVEADA